VKRVRTKLTWIALALPLLAIGLGVVRAELFLRRAHELVLPIQGYDPRDLLHRHYIQFRLALEHTSDRSSCAGEACCLCLMRGSSEVRACSEVRSGCDAFLPLEAAERSWRFYVPEARALDLERALREAHARGRAFAVFAVQGSGQARVQALQLDGERYGSAGVSQATVP